MNILTILCFLLPILLYRFSTCKANDFWDGSIRSPKAGEFLFVASIGLRNYGVDPALPVRVCSGVLITRRHIITTAHCLNEAKNFSDVRIKLGFKDGISTAKYDIKAWTTYEKAIWAKDNDIVPEPLEHNIAILKLEEKSEKIIKPAVVTNSSNSFFDDKQVTTVVWYPHKKYKSSMLLKVAELDVVNHAECMKELNDSPLMLKNHTVDKTYMCTKLNLGAVMDSIDSGTPLLINNNELIAINDPTYLRRNGIHAPSNLNFHIGLDYYRTFIKNVTETKAAKWWRWSRN